MSRPVAQAERGAGRLVRPPHNLIHRNKVPNPIDMRVSSRFDCVEGLPPELLKVRCVSSFLMGWRAANGAMSKS